MGGGWGSQVFSLLEGRGGKSETLWSLKELKRKIAAKRLVVPLV